MSPPVWMMAALLSTTAQAAPADDGWTVHSDAELQAALQGACERATAVGKPVLLAFSAPWCLDCKVLHKLETDPSVAGELSHWESVTTDVGRFDRHQPLMRSFGGDRIAWWVALAPTPAQCTTAASGWPVLRSGAIEPASGTGLQTADDLVKWLTDARSGRKN